MFNKISISLCFLLLLSACSSLPDLPDMPSMISMPSILDINAEPETEEGDAEAPIQYQSTGNGYLSFSYNRGHLESIKVEWDDEEIELSRGATVITKVPVGRYTIGVSGDQKVIYNLLTSISYDGQTQAYSFNVPSPNAREFDPSVSSGNLAHSMSALVVGSSLIEPTIQITKLDSPAYVFKEDQKCGDNCTMVKVLQFTSPKNLLLPEGKYRIAASGESRDVYLEGSTVNTIELKARGFDFESDEIVESPGGREWKRVIQALGL